MTVRQSKPLILVAVKATLCMAVIVFLVGCSGGKVIRHDYTFAGESENWSVVFKQEGKEIFTKKDGKLQYDKDSQGGFMLTYQGDLADLESMRDFAVRYEFRSGGGEQSEHYEDGDKRPPALPFSISTSGHIVYEDEVITVTITMDGQEEIMKLKRVQ